MLPRNIDQAVGDHREGNESWKEKFSFILPREFPWHFAHNVAFWGKDKDDTRCLLLVYWNLARKTNSGLMLWNLSSSPEFWVSNKRRNIWYFWQSIQKSSRSNMEAQQFQISLELFQESSFNISWDVGKGGLASWNLHFHLNTSNPYYLYSKWWDGGGPFLLLPFLFFIFYSSFSFIAKLSGRYKDFPSPLCPHMPSLPTYQYAPLESTFTLQLLVVCSQWIWVNG